MSLLSENKRQTCFMQGWDDCLKGNEIPPHYDDEMKYAAWLSGYQSCERGDALPEWYDSWVKRQKALAEASEAILKMRDEPWNT